MDFLMKKKPKTTISRALPIRCLRISSLKLADAVRARVALSAGRAALRRPYGVQACASALVLVLAPPDTVRWM